MYKLSFHSDVKKDLEQIGWSDSLAAARFHAFFTEVKDNPYLLLTSSLQNKDSETNFNDLINIKRWVSMGNSGKDLRRLRFSDFAYRNPDYRIIFFVSEALKRIIILAILKREEVNYDDLNDPICRRISSAYAQYISKK